jgi:hypothetical protein
VAATLTDELTRVSVANIEKWDEGPDGTLYVYGKCTTPEVDTDEQVVDSGWSGDALKSYLATAPTVRVQHNPQRDPAGSGVRVDINRDGDGAHWLKAAIDEPIAQRLVKKKHLRAFSVGISRPVIERDITGKARGGIIKGGTIVEVSLVDSPANRSCFLEIAKSAADGTCEFTGKVGGSDDFIQKALGDDLLTKDGTGAADGSSRVGFADDLSVSITPDDVMRLMQQKFVTRHYDELAVKAIADAEDGLLGKDHREFSADERRHQAGQGNALPDGSYPIPDKDALHRASVLARSGHGNVAAARRLIARRARELGVQNPLDESDAVKKDAGEGEQAAVAKALTALDTFAAAGSKEDAVAALETVAAAVKEAAPAETETVTPDVTKDPAPKPVKKAKKPKKLPPWLNKPKDGDGDCDDEKGSSGDTGACKSVTDHLWTGVEGTSDVVCSKCRTTPAQAAGVTASPMDPAPVGELMETPMPASVKSAPTPASASGAVGEHMTPVPQHREPDGAGVEPFEHDAGLPATGQGETPTRLEMPTMKASPEVSVLLRYKSIGIDPDLGILHDLTCPAYHPDDVAKYHPFADLSTLIDEAAWGQKALDAACGPIEHALKMDELVRAATALKAADPALVNDWRLAAYKAFRDANPGPSSYPTPGMISPQKYNRPLITDGHEASSSGHAGPNMSPQVATTAPDAHSFSRPPLAEAHASPSPSFMKAGFAYPGQQGVPVQLTYARQQEEAAHAALGHMHTHLASMFPMACPMDMNSRGPQGKHPVPAAAGIGKSEDAVKVPAGDGEAILGKAATPSVAAALKADPEDEGQFIDADVYKGFKKMRKKLGKRVLAGEMTVDEARAKMGRQFAQKGAEKPQEAAGKSAASPVDDAAPAIATIPEIVKAAVAEAFRAQAVPLEAVTLEAANYGTDPEVIKTAVAEALSPVMEQFNTKLAEQQRVIDAIADQPDPSTAAFSGLAFNPVRKAARPAGVTEIAEAAARAQRATERELENLYNSSSDPLAREAYYATLSKMRGGPTP